MQAPPAKALVKAEPSCRALVLAEPEQPEEAGLEKPFVSVARARRPGSRVAQKEEHLMEMMGHSFIPKTLAKKRPAAALEKAAAKAPKAAAKAKAAAKGPLEKGTEDPGRKPWVKLRKTIAQNPKRAYLQGTTDGLEKLRLVVEVPERRTPDFEEIIDQIKAALEKDHLTKAEAIAMRERLYAKKGC